MGKKYHIVAGMNGGFNDIRLRHVGYYDTHEEASDEAYSSAWEEYESWAGLYGVRDREQIMGDYNESYPEDQITEEDDALNDLVRDEMESWTDHFAGLCEDCSECEYYDDCMWQEE